MSTTVDQLDDDALSSPTGDVFRSHTFSRSEGRARPPQDTGPVLGGAGSREPSLHPLPHGHCRLDFLCCAWGRVKTRLRCARPHEIGRPPMASRTRLCDDLWMFRRFQIEHSDDPLDPVTIPGDYVRISEQAGPWRETIDDEIQTLRVGECTKPHGHYVIRRLN